MFGSFVFSDSVFSEIPETQSVVSNYDSLLEDVEAFDVFLVELEPYQLTE